MPGKTVITSREGRVMVCAFNRPKQLNAWNDDLFNHVREAFEEAENDDSVSVLIITGNGRAFSAGADMVETLDRKGGPVYEDPTWDAPFGRCLKAVTTFTKPLLAAVNGVGVGWGMTIIGHCDFTFMSNTARLRTPFAELGLTAEAGSSVTFQRKMGWHNAAHVLMSSKWFGAQECKDMNFIFKVTEPDNLMAETMEYAQELAALPLSSLIATKKLLLQGGRTDAVLAAHERESRAFAPFPKGLSGSPANKEALLAFKERRKPDFSKL